MERIIRDINEFIKTELITANESIIKTAGNTGWTVPADIPYPCFKDIFDSNNPNFSEIESKLTNYYLENIETLFNEINSMKGILPIFLQCLIEESVECYRLKLYQVCVVSLFSALEGVMTFYLDNRDATKYSDNHSKKIRDEEINFEVIGLISVAAFLEKTFNPKKFSEDDNNFSVLNRHWALHGKYKEKISQPSVIKLFVALSTALMIAENVNQLQQHKDQSHTD